MKKLLLAALLLAAVPAFAAAWTVVELGDVLPGLPMYGAVDGHSSYAIAEGETLHGDSGSGESAEDSHVSRREFRGVHTLTPPNAFWMGMGTVSIPSHNTVWFSTRPVPLATRNPLRVGAGTVIVPAGDPVRPPTCPVGRPARYLLGVPSHPVAIARFFEPEPQGVQHVLAHGDVFEVREAVVCLVSVEMVHRNTSWRNAQECFGDELVNVATPAVYRDVEIVQGPTAGAEDKSGLVASHSAEIGYGVEPFGPNDRFPVFHVSVPRKTIISQETFANA